MDFPNVVQKHAGEQQIAVDLRIVPAYQVARLEQRNHVVKQPANVGMMQRLGRRSIAVCLRNWLVVHERLHQRFQMWILECVNEASQRLPQLVDVLRRLRQIVGELDFRLTELANFMDGQLEVVFVAVDQPFNLDVIVLLEGIKRLGDVVPHLGLDLAGAVGERQCQVWIATFLGLHLFRRYDERRGDDLVFTLGTIADEEVFHSWIAALPDAD